MAQLRPIPNLTDKADKVSPATNGNLAGLSASGNLTDSGIAASQVATDSELASGLSGKADVGHTHDDRYYTETEADALLAGKAASSHTHAISHVTGLQAALDEKSEDGHAHDDRYYTDVETDGLLSGKSDTGHTHAIADVTDLQSTLDDKASNDAVSSLQTALDGKADSGHGHSIGDVSGLQDALDGLVPTGDLTAHINSMAPHGATASNTADRIVLRNGTGGFSAGSCTFTQITIGSAPLSQINPVNLYFGGHLGIQDTMVVGGTADGVYRFRVAGTFRSDGNGSFGGVIQIASTVLAPVFSHASGYFSIDSSSANLPVVQIDSTLNYDIRSFKTVAGTAATSSSDTSLHTLSFGGTNHGWVEVTVTIADLSNGSVWFLRKLFTVHYNGTSLAVSNVVTVDPSGCPFTVYIGDLASAPVVYVGNNPSLYNLNISYVISHKFDYDGSAPGGMY